MEAWVAGLPPAGFRQMCSWETYATFAREPEFRTVSLDGRVSLDHRVYRVAAEVIGERVEVWKGVFDLGIYVQDKAGTIYGPFEPESGTIPFGTYRRWRKTERETRVEKIEQMASGLSIPRASMVRDRRSDEERNRVFEVRSVPFVNPIGLLPENYASEKEARRGLFLQFGIPLGSLPDTVLEAIETVLQETLNRREVYRRVKELFQEHNIGG